MSNKRVMKNISICFFCLFVLSEVDNALAVDAFPGAEGSGRFATGGRGGAVYEVTNLSNSGAGSIVDAVSQANRTIVFRVSGTIPLGSVVLEPKSNITIAGQTAPGDGICLKGRIHIKNNAHDIIIRYIRVRVDAGAANSAGDAIDIDSGYNIIIDHVTASYARDETISCQENSDNVTVQWCIMSEALTFESHSYGSLIRGQYGQQKTYHHNLYAHNQGRNPRPGNYLAIGTDPEGLHFDFRNNVTYNWLGSVSGYNDDGPGFVSRYNFIGNDFIRGPESGSGGYAFRESSTDANGYFADNAKDDVVPTGWPGQWFLVNLNPDYFTSVDLINRYRASSEVPMEPVTTTSAAQAKIDVLADAGASYPRRDIIDTRIVNDVLKKTGHSIVDTNSQPEGGWPTLNSLPALTDSDHDGISDIWEISHGLNPNDANDGNGYTLNTDYTNLEVYLDWLVSSVRTDIIYDGIVDFYDFAEFAKHWNTSAGNPLYNEKYDFDHDGIISMNDLFYISRDWLTSGQEY
ncbi:MAG: pectate lyase [Sedimentisphaerales bacterium]